MEHVQSKLDWAEVADIITSQKIAGPTLQALVYDILSGGRCRETMLWMCAGHSWTPVAVPAVLAVVLAVAVDAT